MDKSKELSILESAAVQAEPEDHDEKIEQDPPEDNGPVSVPPFCHYQVWDRQTGALESCGADVTETGANLCAEHAAFVKDATGSFSKSRKPHPAGYDWLAKARAAYGVVSPNMRPSDAGKPPAPFDPSDIAAWNARRCAELYSTSNLPATLDAVAEPECVASLRMAIFNRQWYSETPQPAIPKLAEEIPSPAAPAPVALTREAIEAACRRLMEQKDRYRGTGIPGVFWNVGFRQVYQNRLATEKQIAFMQALIARQPDKYRPILERSAA